MPTKNAFEAAQQRAQDAIETVTMLKGGQASADEWTPLKVHAIRVDSFKAV